jgi:N-terminal domain of galactosyltransferase
MVVFSLRHLGWKPMREQLGVWLKDRWRYERALRSPSPEYLSLANRTERLERAPDGTGFSCRWTFTSRLHAPGIQPSLGQRLMRRCLDHAPIRCAPARPASLSSPEISVLIGHRGRERLPLLLETLNSLAAQQDVDLECLVIEQAAVSEIANDLPVWVRHVLAPLADPSAPYNRSQTFNVGAREARGSTLLLHDNDMLVPAGYCRRILDRRARGYEVINPKRYIFYLTEAHSKAVQGGHAGYDAFPPDYIVQNLEAGGSMAISATAFEAIGGMDEGFVGWGGEDNEFWDRCLTLPTWIWGYEPIVHLWHRSQPLKDDRDNPNISRCREVMERSPIERIETLKQSRGGSLE